MTINYETGEIVSISEHEVRASVRRVIDHAESIWDEWAWQVESRTWTVLGYASWDEMRRGEYGALTSVAAPRAERPELVARFRGAGLTQRETADTLGVDQATVSRHDPTDNTGAGRPRDMQTHNSEPDEIVDAEIVEGDEGDDGDEPAPSVRADPKAPPRKPLTDAFRDRLHDLGRQAESLHRLTEDDRWAQNAEKLAAVKNRNELLRIRDLLDQVIHALPTQENSNV